MDNFAIFHNVMLLVLLFSLMGITPNTRYNQVVDIPNSFWSIPLWVFAIWVLGSNPVYLGTWTDRGAYGSAVIHLQQHGLADVPIGRSGDWLFSVYTYLVGLVTDYKGWFYVTAAIYVGNYLIVARRLTKEYMFVLVVSMLCGFQFYAYGQNTIRAGFSASLILLGISFCNNTKWMLLLFATAFFCHNSMIIPIFALMIAYRFPKEKLFITIWFLAIVISLFAGSTFENFFVGYVDERRSAYFSVDAAKTEYNVGFRWDFLLYSSIAVLLGYYYIGRLKFNNQFYRWIYCAYLIANSVWVLVIRVNYTDRFAYLSWFMFPIILIYPVLSKQLYRDVAMQRNNIILVMVCQFSFTYYMYLRYHGFNMF